MQNLNIPYVLEVEKLVEEGTNVMPIMAALPYLLKFQKAENTEQSVYDAERQLVLNISDIGCSK